ncbi:MAG: squalene--hopene cyclase, partial [Gemmatimonadetes bacterium]|nr:squalene--hopene cyclase [Gemmatimonadota bacterium]
SWALLALLASGESDSHAVRRGIEYLVATQREDGTWEEPWFTGAGFPGYGVGSRSKRARSQGMELPSGFKIKYHLYRNYWPLMALGRFRRCSERCPNRGCLIQ